jgi:hypothetical protein
MPLSPSERTQRAKIASNTSWVNTLDRTARSQPGRDAMAAKFVAECAAAIGQENWDRLTPAQQAKRVANARSAYFQRLAFKSAKARRLRRGGVTNGT